MADIKRITDTELEKKTNVREPTRAPQPSAWREAPGGFVRENPAAKVIEIVENRGGNVYSQRKAYTPPPVNPKKSYAETLMIDIPTRINTMIAKGRDGDIESATAERKAIFDFIDENTDVLNRFTKYKGTDVATKSAAETAGVLASRRFMTPDVLALFDPSTNPMARKFQGLRSGAEPGFISVMEAADKGDAKAASILHAVDSMTGSATRTELAQAQPPARRAPPKPGEPAEAPLPPGPFNAFPEEARANVGSRFVQYNKDAESLLFPGARISAAGPAGAVDLIQPLFEAADSTVYGKGLAQFAASSAGTTETDTPDVYRSKIGDSVRSTAALSQAWNKAPGLPTTGRQLLVPALKGLQEILGPNFTTRTTTAVEALSKVAAIVSDSAGRGRLMDDGAVKSLAKIEMARVSNDETKLDAPERRKLGEMRAADQAVSMDNLRADVGPVTAELLTSQVKGGVPGGALPSEAYPGLKEDISGFAKAASRAKADIAADPTGAMTFKDAFIRHSREVMTESILMKSGADPQAAGDAAEIKARYIADNRGANLATIYDDIYAKYGKTVNQMAMEQAKAMATSPDPADRKGLYAAARANALSLPEADFDRGVWEGLQKIDVKGWDVAPGSKVWKDLNALTDGTASRVLNSALRTPKGVGEAFADLTVAEVSNAKMEDAIVDRLTPLLVADAQKLAPRFSGYAGDEGIAPSARVLIRSYLQRARSSEELRFSANGASKEVLATPLNEVFSGTDGVVNMLRGTPTSSRLSPQKIRDAIGGAALAYVDAVFNTSDAPDKVTLDTNLAEESFARGLSRPFLKALAGDLKLGSDWEGLTNDSGFQVPKAAASSLPLAIKSFAPVFMGAEQLKAPEGGYSPTGAPTAKTGELTTPLFPGQNPALGALTEEGRKLVLGERAQRDARTGGLINAPIDYLLPGDQTVKALNAIRESQMASTRAVTDVVSQNTIAALRERLKDNPFADDAIGVVVNSITAAKGKMTATDIQNFARRATELAQSSALKLARDGQAYKAEIATQNRMKIMEFGAQLKQKYGENVGGVAPTVDESADASR